MTTNFKTGFFYGTGAALNVELGFVPDYVQIVNRTDGDKMHVSWVSKRTMAFTSGGVNEIKAGHTLVGATSGATATVLAVLADTGTWAGGDAAGTLILDAKSIVGTFGSESVYFKGSSSTNDATGAAVGGGGVDLDTEVAGDTVITPYLGVAGSAAHGFTVASGASEDAKLFAYAAFAE
jgi:hypothetical protein